MVGRGQHLATAIGKCKLAEAPGPSCTPLCPFPAQVLTSPSGVTSRNRMFQESATSRFPFGSIAIPIGRQKRDALPLPSANPCASAPAIPPASVETAPRRMTRMRWLFVSET